MKLIFIFILLPILAHAQADEIILNDGEELTVKVQDCAAKSSPVITFKDNKLLGKCVPHVRFCRAVQGYVIPDNSRVSYYSFTKTPTTSSPDKLIRKVRPVHIARPAIYKDIELELKQLIREGKCEKGIYTRGTELTGYITDVVVELKK